MQLEILRLAEYHWSRYPSLSIIFFGSKETHQRNNTSEHFLTQGYSIKVVTMKDLWVIQNNHHIALCFSRNRHFFYIYCTWLVT